LAIKIQQSNIFKFSSDRLKNGKYNINITPNEARKTGELITIGESQMLKSLRSLTNNPLNKEKISQLISEKKKIKNRSFSQENFEQLMKVEQELDDILFVPEIISIVVKNIKHYEHIIKKGLIINGKSFVRLMCSAGHARRNSVLMIDENYEKSLKNILNNDRNNIDMVPAKFNAYFALSSSTSLQVEEPYFCVIPDLKIMRKEMVDFISEGENREDEVVACEKDLEFNLFDGQGLISPRQAKVWAKNLGLDYIPSAFIVRSNFIKGLVVVIDFVEFSDKIGKHIIKDIYGNKVNIRNMDVILTESQFKLYEAFDSTQHFFQNCRKNDLGWWVSRYSPKEENRHTLLNYQFLQVLNLNQDQIESLCEKTLEYFDKIIQNDIVYTLLYLLGEKSQHEFDENLLEKINNNVVKALILNNSLINDAFIQNYIINTLNKKMRDSYIGKIMVEGFYTFMIADPYAFMEYMFGLPVKGLLKRDEYYNRYWLNKKTSRVVAMRSPLTWRSEVDILNLKKNKEIDNWYRYLDNGCVFNVHGCDMAILGGGDFDGDIVCLTDQKEIIDGAYGGLPIFYDTSAASKKQFDEKELYKYDIKGFNSKVGFLTNCSTTMYAMLPLFEKDSSEYQEIIARLKKCRKEQGAIIDATKGLVIKPMPKYWTNWSKISEDMSKEGVKKAKFNNSILVDKRPLFMQFLYQNYRRDFLRHYENYNLCSILKFGIDLEEILELNENVLLEDQKNLIKKYKKFAPLLDTDCTINLLSKYMQRKTKELRAKSRKNISKDTIKILIDADIELDENKLEKLEILYKKYKSGKKNLVFSKLNGRKNHYKTLDQYSNAIRKEAYEISVDICELANLAAEICYRIYPSDNKSFAWYVFGEGMLENIKKNRQKKIMAPFFEPKGNIEYLVNKYAMQGIKVERDNDIF